MKPIPTFLLALTFLLYVFNVVVAEAHRSGCHRWHSCPSDSGSYICGDTGRCSACPNNQFCENGKPVVRSSEPNTNNKSYESNIKEDSLNNFTSNNSIKHSESDYVNYICPRINGIIEHTLDDGSRVDCETETHSIEFDFAKKWAESIGQALYYSSKTGKRAGIFLIISKSNDWKHLEKIRKVIKEKRMSIKVWTVTPKDLNN